MVLKTSLEPSHMIPTVRHIRVLFSSGWGEGLMSSYSFLGASCSLLSSGWDPRWGSRLVISYGYYLGDQAERGLVWPSVSATRRGASSPC